MRNIKVKVHKSSAKLKKEDQLAWKIAEIASDKAPLNEDAIEMVINRIIDNASVAITSFNRKPVISAREIALAHPRENDLVVIAGKEYGAGSSRDWAAKGTKLLGV